MINSVFQELITTIDANNRDSPENFKLLNPVDLASLEPGQTLVDFDYSIKDVVCNKTLYDKVFATKLSTFHGSNHSKFKYVRLMIKEIKGETKKKFLV